MKKLLLNIALFATAGLLLTSCGEDDPGTTTTEPEEATLAGEISASRTLYADTIYTMTEKVWVTNGATLSIEAGTIIKAESKTDAAEAVALIVTAGAKIDAEGTADAPIIFTTDEDDITKTSTGSLTSSTVGKWGGLILIGKATCDVKNEVDGVLIEGVESS